MAELVTELLKRVARVESAYSLQGLSPLTCGGTADYFTEANDVIELATAVKAALDLSIPYIVLGQGRSTLFADGGFPGLVIANHSSNFTMATDKSQVVVDSGLSLDRLITATASRGFGGLTQFHGQGGSIGAALLSDMTIAGQSLRSFVRYVTVLQPPLRLDREATVNRYKVDWFYDKPQGEGSRLARAQESRELGASGAVLLTAVLQLTSLRSEMLHAQVKKFGSALARPLDGFGPLFSIPEGLRLEELYKAAAIQKLRLGAVKIHPKDPNYLLPVGAYRTSGQVDEAIREIAFQVYEKTGVQLETIFSRSGPW